LENFVLSFKTATTQSYPWTLDKIDRPYHQFSLLSLRAQPIKARWLILNYSTTFRVTESYVPTNALLYTVIY